MKDLVGLRRVSPDDAKLRAYWSSCLLATSDVLDARIELTRTLAVMPFWSGGYLARAEAAAALGDEARATADLRTAGGLESAECRDAEAEDERRAAGSGRRGATLRWRRAPRLECSPFRLLTVGT